MQFYTMIQSRILGIVLSKIKVKFLDLICGAKKATGEPSKNKVV